MDKPTRNLIQKATQDARRLLETEFSRQLEGVFDILPDGTVAPEPGEHLDPAQKVIRRKIVAAIEHEKASGMSDGEAAAAYLREASFTCLNRFTALKMLEARGLTLECVSRGEQSSGFKEFCGLAPGLAELPDRGYRLYIESLFDELSTEVRVLFDRRHPASLLWPGRKALEGLLAVLNREEIREIWGEDETIGWVYQYFNSVEERKKMREESAAPRNSRELAVRNQFFTPRYVVEFLTDNTLGRIWYEMRQGQTDLKESCRYLVRRPDEVFLCRMTADDRNLAEMGRLLQEGDEATFPAFSGPEDADRMIQLAHCVDGYQRHPSEDRVGDTWWPWWRKQRIADGEPVEGVSTQDLMDILFAEVRADRHGGDGEMFEDPLTLKMANEVRRRVVESRREDLSQEELLRQPVFVPYRAEKDPRDIRVLDPACGSGHFLLYAFDLLERIYEEAWADGGSPRSEATGRSLRKDYETVEALRAALPKLIMEYNLHGIDIDPRAVQIAVLAIWLRAQKAWQGFGVKAGDRPRVVKSNIVTAEPMPGEESMRREFIEGLQPKVLGQLAEIVFEKMELAGEVGSLLKIEEEIKDAIAKARKQWMETPKHQQMDLFPGMTYQKPKQREFRFDFEGVSDALFWKNAENHILLALKKYSKMAENGHSTQRRLFAEDAERGFAFIDLCRQRYDVVLMNPPFGEPMLSGKAYIQLNYPKWNSDIISGFIDHWTQHLINKGILGAITSRTALFLSSFQFWRKNILLGIAPPTTVADFGQGVLDTAMVETVAYCLQRGNIKPTVFFSLEKTTNRAERLKSVVRFFRNGSISEGLTFVVPPSSFLKIPGAPFSYWISDSVRNLFQELPQFEDDEVQLRVTNPTADEFRFLRNFWECPPDLIGRKQGWVPYAKGGASCKFHYDVNLLVMWDDKIPTYKGYIGTSHRPDIRPASLEFFFRPGIMWPLRAPYMSAQAFPEGTIFSARSQCLFAPKDSLYFYLGLLNSYVFDYVFKAALGRTDFPEFIVGILRKLPKPQVDHATKAMLADKARSAAILTQNSTISDEIVHYFTIPSLAFYREEPTLYDAFTHVKTKTKNTLDAITSKQQELDSISLDVYGVSLPSQRDFAKTLSNGIVCATSNTSQSDDVTDIISSDLNDLLRSLLSWFVGIIFGRWDMRIAFDLSLAPKLPDPFDPLPVCPPGMLIGTNGLPATSDHIVSKEWLRARSKANALPGEGDVKVATISGTKYPLSIMWNGILVDDSGFEGQQLHDDDIILRTREVLEVLWKEKAQDIEQEACDILKIPDLRTYFRKSFFKDHISRYSKSRRKAPIYWQLATPSASYSVWLYYHRFTKDTFYNVLNDYVDKKLQFEERQLTNIRQQYGASPTATQRKEIAARESFVEELSNFKDEIARVAPLWSPNLNDGVIINFAPLWRLVPQNKPWQKECKKVWDKLVKGDYDWAHLAMHLWPERVVPKCTKDRSLAIAHGLDDHFWTEDDKGKPKAKKVSKNAIDALVQERTSPTVKAALDDLLKAPANLTGKKQKKRA